MPLIAHSRCSRHRRRCRREQMKTLSMPSVEVGLTFPHRRTSPLSLPKTRSKLKQQGQVQVQEQVLVQVQVLELEQVVE